MIVRERERHRKEGEWKRVKGSGREMIRKRALN